MKCSLCKKDVSESDPGYPKAHYTCLNIMYDELEKHKIIKVISKHGTNIVFKYTDEFYDYLINYLNENRYYIIMDDTVDEDIVDLQGVLKAMYNYLPENIPKNMLVYISQFVFNTLMSIKYGMPLPEDKNFTYRFKEFYNEVYSMEIPEDIGKFIRGEKKDINNSH